MPGELSPQVAIDFWTLRFIARKKGKIKQKVSSLIQPAYKAKSQEKVKNTTQVQEALACACASFSLLYFRELL